MNFFDKHIGDYIRDTVGLTMLEDGAYNRLIDQVYQTERALPLDKKEVYRMARATSAPERKAVEYVLGKFFHVTDDGYMQKRAQAQIEEFWDRAPATESKKENAKIRQQRTRDRRKMLFERLRELGVTPEFNASMRTLEQALSRVTKPEESQSGHVTVTRDDTLTQTPLPTTQSPELKTQHDDANDSNRDQAAKTPPPGASSLPMEEPEPRHQAIAALLTTAGIRKATPIDTNVIDWAQDLRVTDLVLIAAITSAKATKGTAPIPVGYLRPIIVELLAKPAEKPGKADEPGQRKGPQGMDPKGLDESYDAYDARIQAELEKRKGQP